MHIGELIASAGDGEYLNLFFLLMTANFCLDGMIIIWAQSSTPQPATYGSDIPPEELQNEKVFWRVRIVVRYAILAFGLFE